MIDVGAASLSAGMDAFSQPATLTRGAGPAIPLRGIFDRHALLLDSNQDGAPVSLRRPIFGLVLAELPAGFTPAQGDVLRVQGGSWRVADVQPDGMGSMTLVLTARPMNESTAP